LSDRHGIPKTLPPEISLSLYRVLQEALQNVVSHSQSGHADVSLSGHADTLAMSIQDSGAGFDPHQAMSGRGLGLTSMKERLKVVGGQLSIDAAGARHDDSRRRASPCSNQARKRRAITAGQGLGRRSTQFRADRCDVDPCPAQASIVSV
jgi:signal transduction histidine kinase